MNNLIWKVQKIGLLLAAVLSCLVFHVAESIGNETLPVKLRMPGSKKVTLSKGGAYRIWYIYRWESEEINSKFQEDIAVPAVLNCSTDRYVPVQCCLKDQVSGFVLPEGEGKHLWTVHIASAGTYEITMEPTKSEASFLISIVEEKNNYKFHNNSIFKGLLPRY